MNSFFRSAPEARHSGYAATLMLLISGVGVYLLFFLSIFGQWMKYGQYEKLVVTLIAFYMIWWELRRQAYQTLKSAFAVGTVIVALGIIMMTVGRVSETFLLQEISFGVTLSGILLAAFGYRLFGAMLWPAAYLVLLTGLLQVLLIHYSEILQNLTAQIAFIILKVFGMAVHRNGAFLEMPHIHLEVARICSGIYSLVSFFTLAFPFAFITQRSAGRRVFLLMLAGFFAMFSNGMRVAAIGIWTYFNPGAGIHGLFNDSVSSIFFGLLFILFCSLFLRKNKQEPLNRNGNKLFSSLIKSVAENRIRMPKKVTALFILPLIGLLFNVSYKPIPVYLGKPLDGIPMMIGNWTGRQNSEIIEFYEVQSPDSVLRRTYTNMVTEQQVNLYVAYFAIQEEGKKLIKQPLDLLQGRSEVICLGADGSQKHCVIKTVRDAEHVYYYWYILDGRTYAGRNAAKLASLLNSLAERRNNGALVVVSALRTENQGADNADSAEFEFLNQLIPTLLNFVSDGSVNAHSHAS